MTTTIHYPLKYTIDKNGENYIVGDDLVSNEKPNALDSNAEGKLIIPKIYMGLPVTIIGQYAFRYCTKITEVDVQADIILIKKRAFSDMCGLQKVTLPGSLQRIEDYGLQFSNTGSMSGNVLIVFRNNSQLSYIGNEVFGYKNNVIINYTSDQTPQCHSNSFSGVNLMLICAPSEFLFCGKYLTFTHSKTVSYDCKTDLIKQIMYFHQYHLIYTQILILCKY